MPAPITQWSTLSSAGSDPPTSQFRMSIYDLPQSWDNISSEIKINLFLLLLHSQSDDTMRRSPESNVNGLELAVIWWLPLRWVYANDHNR